MVERLREQLGRLTTAIRSLEPGHLDRIVEPDFGHTLRYSIVHALHDEANHQGEIYLLKKIYARPSAG